MVEDTIKKINKTIEDFKFLEKFKEFKNFMDIKTLDNLGHVNELDTSLRNLDQEFIKVLKLCK